MPQVWGCIIESRVINLILFMLQIWHYMIQKVQGHKSHSVDVICLGECDTEKGHKPILSMLQVSGSTIRRLAMWASRMSRCSRSSRASLSSLATTTCLATTTTCSQHTHQGAPQTTFSTSQGRSILRRETSRMWHVTIDTESWKFSLHQMSLLDLKLQLPVLHGYNCCTHQATVTNNVLVM